MMAHPYPIPYPLPGSGSIPANIMKRPSFCFVARQIYIRDGLVGFFRGLGPCFLRTFPVNASALFVYEEIMRALGAEKVFCNMLNHVNLHMLTALQRHAAK